MKDLDFDELDQAVSSVLGGDSPEEKKETKPEAESTVPIAPVPDAHNQHPTSSPIAPVAERTGSMTAAVSPAVRRRGQFLDMVHPSADMTSRTNVTAPAARKKIAPVSSDVSAPPTSEEKANESAALAAAESEIVPTLAVTTPEPTNDLATVAPDPMTPKPEFSDVTPDEAPDAKKDVAWPDPLDIVSAASNEPTTEPAKEPTDTTDDVAVASAELVMPVAPEASPTPFVTDAKVDKRPLGAFGSIETPEPADGDVETDESNSETALSSSANLDEQRTPDVTPPELQPDVVSVESADKEFASETTDSDHDVDSSDEKPENSGLSQSISQQYRTPAETPDAAPHPIFDTDEYHQPLLPASNQHKKRGWLVVVIILVLLVVGAALGYFAFIAGF